MELSAIALKLEQMGRDGNVDEIRAETPAFLDELRDCIKQLKPKQEHSTAEMTDEDELYLKEKLLLVKEACEEFDDKPAEEAFAELMQKAWPKQINEMLDNISQKLLHSDYSEVADDIAMFLKGASD
jgi:hypothetical protein